MQFRHFSPERAFTAERAPCPHTALPAGTNIRRECEPRRGMAGGGRLHICPTHPVICRATLGRSLKLCAPSACCPSGAEEGFGEHQEIRGEALLLHGSQLCTLPGTRLLLLQLLFSKHAIISVWSNNNQML